MIIKVCGMREAENIREVEKLFTQDSSLFTLHSSLPTFWMGFIFWPKSSRYVAERPAYLPEHAKRVGVFVDEDVEIVKEKAEAFGLDVIQLHGHESSDYISHLSPLTSHLSVIKANNIATAADLSQTAAYEGLVDYFLFDTKATLPGGSGQQFDWSILDAYQGSTPFLLSGGIGPGDAARVKTFLTSHPSPLTSHFSPLTSKMCAGIDLNSRFEIAPALKDVTKLKAFLEKI